MQPFILYCQLPLNRIDTMIAHLNEMKFQWTTSHTHTHTGHTYFDFDVRMITYDTTTVYDSNWSRWTKKKRKKTVEFEIIWSMDTHNFGQIKKKKFN